MEAGFYNPASSWFYKIQSKKKREKMKNLKESNQYIEQFVAQYPDSTREEMRAMRRDLINYHLQNKGNNFQNKAFILHDLKFLVRNGEIYRYSQELKVYA